MLNRDPFVSHFFAPYRSRAWRVGMTIVVMLTLVLVARTAPAKDPVSINGAPAKGSKSSAKKATSKKPPAKDYSDDDKPKTRLERVHEIVVWNEHDGKKHDSGTEKCNLSLSLEGEVVWHRNDVEIPWEANKWANLVIAVPGGIKADKLRVEITSWHEKRGGLAEIEVHDRTGFNLAGGSTVKSDDQSSSNPLAASALVDGNYDSPTNESGYWLLPEGKEGWAEIDLPPQEIPPPPEKRPEEKKGKKVLSRVPLPAEILVSCEDSFELYINGSRVLMGHGQRCFTRDFKIANGDVITAKCEGSSDTKGGFCFLAKFTNGHHLSTLNGWKVYTPSNANDWFNPNRANGTTDATKGTSSWAEREMKDESNGKVPQIWGSGKTVYLVMKANTTVIHPKMKPGQKGRKR